MKAGNVINIFTDPTTCTIEEGRATLINFTTSIDSLEKWNVEFLDHPGFVYERWIKTT